MDNHRQKKPHVQLGPAAWCFAGALCFQLAWIGAGFSALSLPVLAGGSPLDAAGICFIATFAAVGAFGGRFSERVQTPVVLLASCIVMLLSLLLGFSVALGAIAAPSGIVAAIVQSCLGISIALYLVALFGAFCALEYEQGVVSSALAFAGSAVLVALFVALGNVGGYILAIVLLAGSFMCFAAGRRASARARSQSGRELPVLADAQSKPYRKLIAALMAMLFCVSFSNNAIRAGYSVALSYHNDVVGYGEAVACYAIVVVVGVALLAHALRSANARRSFPKGYRALVFALLIVGLLPLTMLEPLSWARVFAALQFGVYRCFEFFVWALLLRLRVSGYAQMVANYGMSQAALALGAFCGAGAVSLSMSSDQGALNAVYPLVLVCVVLLLAAYLGIFQEKDLTALLHMAEPPQGGRFMAQCARIAREFGLSKREAEIMVLFAKGRNAEYIHNELVISKNTVSMHRQNIYQKLGIHSQQELIDMVEEGKRKGD